MEVNTQLNQKIFLSDMPKNIENFSFCNKWQQKQGYIKIWKGYKKSCFNTVNRRRNTLWLFLSLISVSSSPNSINLCLLKFYSVEILDNSCIYFG